MPTFAGSHALPKCITEDHDSGVRAIRGRAVGVRGVGDHDVGVHTDNGHGA